MKCTQMIPQNVKFRTKNAVFLLFIIVFLNAVFIMPAIEASPVEEIQVSVDTGQSIFEKPHPAALRHSSGGACFVWYDLRNGWWSLVGSWLDADGNLSVSDFILDTTVDPNDRPGLVEDASGNVLISYNGWASALGTPYIPVIVRVNTSGTIIGTYYAIDDGVTPGKTYGADIATDGPGNFVEVWMEDGRDTVNPERHIMMQRFDAAGVKLGPNIQVTTLPLEINNYTAVHPRVVCNSSGATVVSWTNYHTSSRSGVFFQRYDASGNPVGVNTLINTDGSGTSHLGFQDLAIDGSGAFLAAWEDTNYSPAVYIRGQLYDSTGTPVGNNFSINEGTTPTGWDPTVAYDPSGHFFVTWGDERDYTDRDVYYQRISLSTGMVGNNVLINTDSSGTDQYYPSVFSNLSQGLVVGWIDSRRANEADIYCQFYDTVPSPDGDNRLVNDPTVTGTCQFTTSVAVSSSGAWVVVYDQHEDELVSQVYSSTNTPLGRAIICDAAGVYRQYMVSDNGAGFVVVWYDYDISSGSRELYAQRIDDTGILVGSAINVTAGPNDNRCEDPAVAGVPGGGFIVVWRGSDSTYTYRIMAQLYDQNGNAVGDHIGIPHDLPSSGNYSSMFNPAVASHGNNGFTVYWRDRRNGFYEIYSQRFDATGTPVGTNLLVSDLLHQPNNYRPLVSSNGSSTDIVMWDIYPNSLAFQLVDHQGNLLGSNQFVLSASNSAFGPSVAMTSDGRFALSWADYDPFTSHWVIAVQRYDAAGGPYLEKQEVAGKNVNELWYYERRNNLAITPSDTVICGWSGYRTPGQGFDAFVTLFGWNETLIERPAGLHASEDDSLVQLGWNAVSGASGYHVYRGFSTNFTEERLSPTGGILSPSFTDNSAQNQTLYYYRVSTLAGDWESVRSFYVHAAPHTSTDVDTDMLPDDWEIAFFGDLSQGWFDLSDADTLSNGQEYEWGLYKSMSRAMKGAGLNPAEADSDGDSHNDDIEVAESSNPLDPTSVPPLGPPDAPYNPNPTDMNPSVSIQPFITWQFGAHTETYELYFDTTNPPITLVDSGTAGPAGGYDPGRLPYDATYYWQVVVYNSAKATTEGPVWSFTVKSSVERDALIALYNSTSGAGWNNNTNWPSGDPCLDSWFGINCDSSKTSVLQINLPNNNLAGTLPTGLGNLANLQYVYLYNNQLTGAIPVELGNCSNLRNLSLNSNQLSGTIPAELGNLTLLNSLYLMHNQLTAEIPATLGNCFSLRNLSLNSNQLSGTIPAELGNLTQLQFLVLQSNQLTGAVPTELQNLTSLYSGSSDFRWNGLYTDDDMLRAFLNEKQTGGNWEGTQTIAPGNVAASVCPGTLAIEVSWDPIVYTADSGGYEVQYGTTPGGPYTSYGMTADKTTTGMLVNGLTNEQMYYFTVNSVTFPHANNANTVNSGPGSEVSETANYELLDIVLSKEGNNVRFDWASCNLAAFEVLVSSTPTGLTALNDPLNDGFSPEYHSNALLESGNTFYMLNEAGL